MMSHYLNIFLTTLFISLPAFTSSFFIETRKQNINLNEEHLLNWNRRRTFNHLKSVSAVTCTATSENEFYCIGGAELSKTWLDFVKAGKVCTQMTIDDIPIEYGVKHQGNKFQEYVQILSDKISLSPSYAMLQNINTTLSSSNPKPTQTTGDYMAQLQLIRTLRPPPSAGFIGATSSTPPVYDFNKDSFIVGDLKLTNRPRAAFLHSSDLKTPWDVYHNISPADNRGHFLLLPTLENTFDNEIYNKNNRGQTLLEQDCQDLVHLVSTIRPIGSLWVVYNSVGAGASQNHIHCHAWPAPQISPLSDDSSSIDRVVDKVSPLWEVYAVSKVRYIHDYQDIFQDQVQITWLKYPCFCILISAKTQHATKLGSTLHTILNSISDAPFNVAFVNRPNNSNENMDDFHSSPNSDKINDDGDDITFKNLAEVNQNLNEDSNIDVDVYVFVRSKERYSLLPSLKLGASEMLGVFHAQSLEEMKVLSKPIDDIRNEKDAMDNDHKEIEENLLYPMELALQHVSYESEVELWELIRSRILDLETSFTSN